MENKNIKSINTIGKVGNIVTIVIQVVMIVGIISSIIAGIVILQLPNDSIRVSGSGNADITLKTSQLVSRVIEIDNIDNSTFKLDMFGIKAKITTRSEDISDYENNYQISAEADGVTGREIKVFFATTCFTGAIVVALFLIASVFVRKLAKVLSKCRSPFEESVIKAMRAFGDLAHSVGGVQTLRRKHGRSSDLAACVCDFPSRENFQVRRGTPAGVGRDSLR